MRRYVRCYNTGIVSSGRDARIWRGIKLIREQCSEVLKGLYYIYGTLERSGGFRRGAIYTFLQRKLAVFFYPRKERLKVTLAWTFL